MATKPAKIDHVKYRASCWESCYTPALSHQTAPRMLLLVLLVRHVVRRGVEHSLRTWEMTWENDESKQQQKEFTRNGNSCLRIKIVFLDQYSWSKYVRIINEVAKKVSFKCRSPWILWSFEIKWVISWNNYLHDFAEFFRELSTFAFTWYPTEE